MSVIVHITGIFVALFMIWLARSRLRKRSPSERGVLTYPPLLLVVGVIYTLTFLGFAILMFLTLPDSAERWNFFLLFVAFSLGGLPIIAASLFERHRVSVGGIEYSPLFGIGTFGYLPWAEVRRVKFSRFMGWFILEGHDGTKVRVSAMMMGLPEFAQCLLAGVDPKVMDTQTLYLLQQTAHGILPRLGI